MHIFKVLYLVHRQKYTHILHTIWTVAPFSAPVVIQISTQTQVKLLMNLVRDSLAHNKRITKILNNKEKENAATLCEPERAVIR